MRRYPPTQWSPWGKVRWGLLTPIRLGLSLTCWALYCAGNYAAP